MTHIFYLISEHHDITVSTTAIDAVFSASMAIELVVSHLLHHNFFRFGSNVVHPAALLHLVIAFQFLSHTFSLFHLFGDQFVAILCLLIHRGHLIEEPSTQHQLGEVYWMIINRQAEVLS